jgi:hypothetical protein
VYSGFRAGVAAVVIVVIERSPLVQDISKHRLATSMPAIAPAVCKTERAPLKKLLKCKAFCNVIGIPFALY